MFEFVVVEEDCCGRGVWCWIVVLLWELVVRQKVGLQWNVKEHRVVYTGQLVGRLQQGDRTRTIVCFVHEFHSHYASRTQLSHYQSYQSLVYYTVSKPLFI